MALLLTTPSDRTRSILLEGPSGCGKSFLAKCLAKITGAELMVLSCYHGMNTQHLIEVPSSLAIASSMAGEEVAAKDKLMNLGILSRAFLKSQSQPVVLLVDEIDKVDGHIDTFFLGPIQDARIHLESRPPIDCNINNLLVIFTKNFNRKLDDAFLRRVHPMKMAYLDSTLERRVLSKHCEPQLVANLVWIAERMRNSQGTYQFERPPAPEELLAVGQYVQRLLDWGVQDFAWVGKNVWAMISKSEHDRAVLDHMLRYHPDFLDPLHMDGKNATIDVINARLGRIVLRDIIEDPDQDRRERAWVEMEYT
jgi:MoxR-like ATPase